MGVENASSGKWGARGVFLSLVPSDHQRERAGDKGKGVLAAAATPPQFARHPSISSTGPTQPPRREREREKD